MCTILFAPETLAAEKRSREESQKAVDRLMEYDRQLSAPFTREELKEIFSGSRMRSGNLQEVYALLTGEEKRIVDGSGFFPAGAETACGPSRTAHPADEAPESSDVRKLRRRWKAELLKTPVFDEPFSGVFSHLFGGGGNIYVWLDSCCFGNSRKKGFYYVRYQLSMLAWGSTAYAHPVLIVEKNKLRPDQVEYMERKCLETRKEARNRAS